MMDGKAYRVPERPLFDKLLNGISQLLEDFANQKRRIFIGNFVVSSPSPINRLKHAFRAGFLPK